MADNVGNSFVHDYAKGLILQIMELDKAIELAETKKAQLRIDLEKIMGSSASLEINGVAVIKRTPESIIYSYDTKLIQSVLEKLLRDGLHDHATMLANAKKESTRKASIRISKWKDGE
jgi:hypothetical protein